MLADFNVKFCLFLYSFSGVNPGKVGWFHNLLFIIILSANLFILTMTLLYFVYAESLTLTEVVGPLESMFLLCHGTLKLVGLYSNKSSLGKLLARISDFKKIEDVDDEADNKSYLATVGTLKTLTGFYVITSVWAVYAIAVKPILFDNALIFACHIPEKMPYGSMLALQMYNYPMGIYVPCVGLDFIYMTLALLITMQFQLLNHHVRRLVPDCADEEEAATRMRIKKWVDYHNFLLDYVRLFNETFSTTLFFFFGIMILSSCTELFIMSIQPSGDVMKYYSYISMLMLEFVAFYCFPGQKMADEANKISEKIWETTWVENQSRSVKTAIGMALIQSQRPVFVKAGIVNATYATCLSGLKTIASYFMFLKTLTK